MGDVVFKGEVEFVIGTVEVIGSGAVLLTGRGDVTFTGKGEVTFTGNGEVTLTGSGVVELKIVPLASVPLGPVPFTAKMPKVGVANAAGDRKKRARVEIVNIVTRTSARSRLRWVSGIVSGISWGAAAVSCPRQAVEPVRIAFEGHSLCKSRSFP